MYVVIEGEYLKLLTTARTRAAYAFCLVMQSVLQEIQDFKPRQDYYSLADVC